MVTLTVFTHAHSTLSVLRVFAIILFAIMLVDCDKHVENKEEIVEGNSLKDVVVQVAEELRALGFPIDCSNIKIEVKEASEMASLFNKISDESRLEVNNYTPFGPLKLARKNDSTTFDDGDSSRLAFYDPNSQAIVFKKGSMGNLTKGYLAHELAHAYQDQKWGFDTIWQTYQEKPTREAFNITQFIIEGHAELVRHAYEQNHVGPRDRKEIGLHLGKMSENDCIPCHTKQSLATLPYVFGMRFLVKQFRDGGWPQAESFFTNLPSSTEQIIHENKYDGDIPTSMSLPLWDDPAFNAVAVLNGSLGEAFLLAKLLSMPISPEKAFSSASGWDGDVAQLYRLPDGREALVWRLIFDRVQDAQQLEEALKNFGAESQVFRMGRVVDWLVTKYPDLRRNILLFLSKHRVNYDSNWADEQSTLLQEELIKDDATLFDNPNFVPKIVIGPNL